MQAPQTIPQYAHSTQVCEHIHTWKSNSLAIKPMVFQVRLVSRTWKSGTPIEHSVREVGNGDSVITVYAYGYRRMQRLTYASVWGGDGRSDQVPVYRDEYISVTGQGSIRIREDIDFEYSAISQRERLDHINTVLDSANLNIYRRPIAPKV